MKKFYILDTKNNLWSKKLESFDKEKKDIFYSQEFAKLCQDTIYNKYLVLCLVAEDSKDIILCPLIKRSFEYNGKKFFDLTSLYNLGGPIQNSNNIDLQNFFSKKLNEFCKDNKIINYFIRFHPFIMNSNMNLSKCDKENTGDFISVNLNNLNYPIYKNFEYRHIKSIKKALNAKIEIIVSNNLKFSSFFFDIYHQEMKLKKAEKFYFFQKKFFEKLKDYISGYQFFLAKLDNKIISGELVLFGDIFCHSFLGATKQEYKHLCANHLIKERILSYFKEKKLSYYLIGGGSEGIIKYKIGFSNEKIRPNIIGKINYNESFYNNLINKFKIRYKDKADSFAKLQFYENYL